jgi:hypothetical protein
MRIIMKTKGGIGLGVYNYEGFSFYGGRLLVVVN